MDCLTELAKEAVTKLGDLAVESTVKQFKYLIQHKKITANLKEELEKLKMMKQALQARVTTESRKGNEIDPSVQKWLSDVATIENELPNFYSNEVNKNKKCFAGHCPDLAFNYSLGKRAAKSTEYITSLKEEENKFHSQAISYPKAPSSLGSTFTKDIMNLVSREKIITQVIDKLKDDQVKMISICGMGGVGKTTLVKELIKTIEKSKLFDEVVMAVVSQEINHDQIQIQIAEMLGMECKKTMQGRAIQLLERLGKANSRVLIVLDDVWEELDFERIGLPYGEHEKACKILFTSRDEKVCQKMGSKVNFQVSVLLEDEAWCLFREMAGEVVDEPDINPIAREVSKECGGLPLAIVTVGKALSNERKSSWDNALQQLRNSQSSPFLDAEKFVYPRIELSLNFLGREHKFFLMLCGLFPEDFDIPIESLLCHAMGLGLFKDIGASWRARNRTHTLVGDLKRKFLLLDSNVPGCVKMHDIVRDVVISLVFKNAKHGFMVQNDMKKLKEEKLKDIIAISLILDDKTELENGLECPILQLLQVRSKSKKPIFWPELFFQGMRALKVLSMQNLHNPKLPSLSQALVNLHMLQVEHCDDVGDISIIGNELIHLQVLSFAHSNIKELPTEIGNLGSLKLLDLTECNDLNFISANVLIRLTQLEELYFRTKNFPWKKNDVMINELKNMSQQLKLVEMKVRGTEISAIDLNFKNLEKFWVYVDPYTKFQRSAYLESNLLQVSGIDYKSIKSMLMILQLVNKCEILAIRKVKDLKNVTSQLGEHLLPHLKDLRIDSCPNLEYLIDCTVHCNAFPQIQSLSLKNLNNLREICYTFNHHEVKASMIEFPNLVKLELIDLPSLIGFSKATDLNELHQGQRITLSGGLTTVSMNTRLFSSAWMKQFPKLETILVQNCSSINMVFDIHGYSHLDGQLFPRLKEIKIVNLNKLTHVWSKAMHGVQGFQNLKFLTISQCNSMKHVFTPTIVRAITNLEKLEIESCKLLENLVTNNEDTEEGDHEHKEELNVILFDKLDSLNLSRLPNIVGICANSDGLEFPSLRKLKIDDCPKLDVSFLTTSYTKHDNVSVASSSKTSGTCFSNIEEEHYSRSYNRPVGCMPLCSKLIRQSNLNKKINKAPSISKRKIKVEVGRLPLLEELYVKNCNLHDKFFLQEGDETRIRREAVIDGFLFPKLKSLTMVRCDNVSILLSPSSLRSLEHLEELHLQGCKDLNEIVSQEEIEACGNKIIFPALRHLLLQELPNLKAFCLGSYDFDFPSLQKVEIKDCPNMDVFSQGSSHMPKLEVVKLVNIMSKSLSSHYIHKKDMNATIKGFKAFEALHESEMLSWTNIRNKSMFGYFVKKSKMYVTRFNRLSVLVSLNEIQMLHQVRSLTISNCNSLVEVFESGGQEGTIRGDVTPTHYQLQEMTLDNLPKLSHIWKHNFMEVVSFHKLTSLAIKRCHSLKSLLSYSMARSLIQLQKLSVVWCDMMEEIVTKEDENIEGGSKVKILFPQLESLRLEYLPMLEGFCSGEYDYDIPLCDVGKDKEINSNNKVQISFPKLEVLFLYEVPKLKCFCSGAYDYDIMVSSIEEYPKIATFPRGNVIVSTPNLHLLRWNYTDMHTLGDLNLTIHYHQNSVKYEVQLQKLETFSGVKRDERLMAYIERVTRLQIEECHKLLNCIPSNMMHLFSHLKGLSVRECECLEEIFESSDYEGDNMMHYELQFIELLSLPKLRHIWKNHGQIFGFQKLESITIMQCHDLKYLFPNVSMATSLPYLDRLHVSECNKMEEIVGNNYNPIFVQEEQQHAKIKFPHLGAIYLKNLPSLKCFCRSSFPCYVEMPECYRIRIEDCPEMKTFWYDGTLYTPHLVYLYVENTRFDNDEELNEVIRHSTTINASVGVRLL